ncbi:unnamed protein product [Pleuronectes platessa]|uniref:Uncharacterized protein n=1 Tax=Pleuronectes platessa TaxID=8262 RepID=A0A9N7U744_PLEPL|nr:unnamed protein product [Pleuronectes platessa]
MSVGWEAAAGNPPQHGESPTLGDDFAVCKLNSKLPPPTGTPSIPHITVMVTNTSSYETNVCFHLHVSVQPLHHVQPVMNDLRDIGGGDENLGRTEETGGCFTATRPKRLQLFPMATLVGGVNIIERRETLSYREALKTFSHEGADQCERQCEARTHFTTLVRHSREVAEEKLRGSSCRKRWSQYECVGPNM